MPRELLFDIISGLSQRIHIVLVTSKELDPKFEGSGDRIVRVGDNDCEKIIATALVLLQRKSRSYKPQTPTVPFFNIEIPANQLTTYGGIGILTIDSSSFTDISSEYGTEVYVKLKEVFQDMLYDLWGRSGSFRKEDILFRSSASSNQYYIFLGHSRETGVLPYPGSLEKLADRLMANIQSAIWEELCKPPAKRRIPACIDSIPLPGVGYVGVLENPCIDPIETIENGIEDAKRVTAFQVKRIKERQLELMQTLIQSDRYLVPHFQGVFFLQNITEEMVEHTKSTKSLAPLRDHVFGFEALIRVNKKQAETLVENESLSITGMKVEYMRPDVLFDLAKITRVSLELDQACLRHAASHSHDLPGQLMVNILPRNLYHIEQLTPNFENRRDILFEVSESEAINNFELMTKSVKHLNSLGMGIAADDFGKGFSSLERIIKIHPSVIKFDRSMIENIDKDPIKHAYIKGMVEAAKIIKTTVLAEGVETWEEAHVLKAMGIELIQGFLFHRPESAEAILESLDNKDGKLQLNTVA